MKSRQKIILRLTIHPTKNHEITQKQTHPRSEAMKLNPVWKAKHPRKLERRKNKILPQRRPNGPIRQILTLTRLRCQDDRK